MPGDRGPLALVIPAKSLDLAKSRLDAPAATRRAVALQLLRHSVRTALASEVVRSVSVVTADPLLAGVAAGLGARVVTEPIVGDLNRALRLGREQARRTIGAEAVGFLMADLPHLSAAALEATFHAYRQHRSTVFVPDIDGTGTTALIHSRRNRPTLHFGHASAAAHLGEGYVPVAHDQPDIRRDLDTVADATAAIGERPHAALAASTQAEPLY